MALFRRIKEPVHGTAQITAASGMPEAGTGAARCTMHLVVQAPGIDPYPAEMTKIVRAKRWPFPGMTVPVTVDARDLSRIEIDWDSVPTREELARAQAEQTAHALGGAPTTTGAMTEGSGIPPEAQAIIDQLGLQGSQVIVNGRAAGAAHPTGDAAPPHDEDRLGSLERLAALHRQGALTDDEFAAEKARLLGG